MFPLFGDFVKICNELEKIRVAAQANEIVFRQTGENSTADRFMKLETKVSMALAILREAEAE